MIACASFVIAQRTRIAELTDTEQLSPGAMERDQGATVRAVLTLTG
jgi:hypothetical protein